MVICQKTQKIEKVFQQTPRNCVLNVHLGVLSTYKHITGIT